MAQVLIEGEQYCSNASNIVANLDLPLEASCESDRLDPSLLYRIVLSSSWNPGPARPDIKSAYVLAKPAGRGGRVVWTKPFGNNT